MNLQPAQWPDGAKCIVAITIDWDGHSLEVGRGLEPVGIRAAGGYSARRGVRRMLDMFERHQIAATFFVPGYDAERHPEGVRGLIDAGHEVGTHGYTHESDLLERDQERELLERAVSPHPKTSPGCATSAIGTRAATRTTSAPTPWSSRANRRGR